MTSPVKTVTVISSDRDEFEMAINVATQSKLIENMIDDLGVSHKIPLYNVNSVILTKVIEYCRKHADHEMTNDGAANDAAREEELKNWDAEFFKMDNDFLFNIILASNYMEITGLFDSSCQAVADMIKDKTPEQVRQIFNIKNDFTPEEEQQMREENQWAFNV